MRPPTRSALSHTTRLTSARRRCTACANARPAMPAPTTPTRTLGEPPLDEVGERVEERREVVQRFGAHVVTDPLAPRALRGQHVDLLQDFDRIGAEAKRPAGE